MRNKFLEDVGGKLSDIMENRGIKSAQELSDMMGGNDKTRNINYHRGAKHEMRVSQLDEYCAFFGCSADYLLGYIPEETHELTDIAEATGLSEAAIHKIQSIGKDSRLSSALNFLLESKALDDILIDLYEYENRRLHCSIAREEMDSAETDEEYYEREATFLADQDSMISWEYRTGRSLNKIIDEWTEAADNLAPEEMLERIKSFIPFAV